MPNERENNYQHQEAGEDPGLQVPLTEYTAEQQIAITCLMLADDGRCSGLVDQITALADEPRAMWTQRFGFGLDETKVSDLVLIDAGNLVKGAGMPNPANRFRRYSYRARPDIRCIIHRKEAAYGIGRNL